MQRYLLILLFLISASVYGMEATIDASSEASMSASYEKMQASMTDEDKKTFMSAVQTVSLSTINVAEIMRSGNKVDRETALKKVQTLLDGKSAAEVIRMAKDIKEKKKAGYTKNVETINQKEIKNLKEKQSAAKESARQRQAVEIIESSFQVKKEEFGKKTVIKITVKNTLKEAISIIAFNATLKSPERAVPWFSGEFSHSISGGLEPNEQATWTLKPFGLQHWGLKELPDNVVFTPEVKQVYDSSKKPLFSDKSFSDKDKERLETLLKQSANNKS